MTRLLSLAEIERKAEECMKEIHDKGTLDEEIVELRNPAEKTCTWVYDHSDSCDVKLWCDWRDSKVSGIMLLTGGIGTGKSTLALNAIDALRNYPSPQCRLVSASFCKDQTAYNHCEAILRGLLYGLVRDDPEARNILVRYRNSSNGAGSGRNLNAFQSFKTLSRCFEECVQVRKRELCLVVDGLDECEEKSRSKLLEYLTTLVEVAQRAASSLPLKVLFLSRPINTILHKLPSSQKLDLGDVRKSDETRRIIEYLVKRDMPPLDDLLRTKLTSILEEKAEGCIQWATLVVDYLSLFDVGTLHSIESELRQLSNGENGLDKTYLTLFGRHFDKSSAEYFNTALRLVAGAARPLSVDELANAMIVNSLQYPIVSKEDFGKAAQVHRLSRLQPFVRISNQHSKIHMHDSLRNLILRKPNLADYDSTTSVITSHSRLALSRLLTTTCLNFLLLPYFQEKDVQKDFNLDEERAEREVLALFNGVMAAYEDEELSYDDNRDQETERNEGPVFFAYATEHWEHHFSDADLSQDLIDKWSKLLEPGSLQCKNWWEQYKFAHKIWEPEDMSPVLAAIYFGHENVIKALLQDVPGERKYNLCRDNAGSPQQGIFVTYEVLTLAIRMISINSFELLHHAASDDLIKAHGHLILLSAIQERRRDVFGVLISDPRVEIARRMHYGERNQTILTKIAWQGDIEGLRCLLRLLQTKRRSEILSLLDDDGDEEQSSPLWYAAQWGHTKVVEALCSLDPDMIHAQLVCPGKFGDHILAAAARNGDAEMMAALLKVCPEYVDRRCSDGDTPLHVAKWNSDYRGAGVAEVLLATGRVDVESKLQSGQTPLMGAFRFGRLELCKVLVRYGADMSKIIHVSEHGSPVCLVSCGFLVKDAELRDALLEFSRATKHAS